MTQRKIIHIDMDAFYASVEIRDNPALFGKAVVVGGSPQSRSVVCTASYEARKFGVRSAMPCSQAFRLCPQAVFIPPHFEKYRVVSEEIRAIFARFTSAIEPLSLDEAYLDVTGHELYAVQIARQIQECVRSELRLSCSAGVGPNKMIAKIASDQRKPGGLTAILPDQIMAFLEHKPLRIIHGIGPATEKRLAQHGLERCSDVWTFELDKLSEIFGTRMATWLFERSRGIDEREVKSSRERKSLGCETTFSTDLQTDKEKHGELKKLADHLAASLRKRNLLGRTITLKVKYSDFVTRTRSRTVEQPTCSAEDFFSISCALLEKVEAKPLRLLGISAAVV